MAKENQQKQATPLLSLLKSDMSDTCFIEIAIFSTIGSLTGAFATAIFCSDQFTPVARSFQFLFRRASDAAA